MSKSTPAQLAASVAATAVALQQQAQLLQQRGDRAQALLAYGRAIALDQSFWPAWFERGSLKLEMGDTAGALQDLDSAVQIAPKQARTWLILGNACDAAGQSERALACFQRALAIDPAYAEAYHNIGVIQYRRGELKATVASYRAALERKPEFVLARSNLAIALEAQGDTAAALAQYDVAITSDPNDAAVRWNKALLLLRNGNYAEGWKLHEWRWASGKAGRVRHYPGRPLWLGGTPIAGRTILLYAEQGLGDTIQFLRFVAQVEAAGARVVLQVFMPLKALIASQSGTRQVIGMGEPLPPFDLQCPLLSLPLAFGSTLATIPQHMPYLVSAADRVAAWARQLGRTDRLRVGLVWKGNPKNPDDAARSIPLGVFTDVLLPEVDFVCLQQDLAPAEITALQTFGQVRVFGAALGDFSTTAALVACCDLVISVDTAMAHLAGAMGKPTWVLLAKRADWRWLQDRADSPWYPSAQLFRQAQQGVWQDVIDAVRMALSERVKHYASARRESKRIR